ncbi:DNA phosphorothioation-associated putative methyltransferase [Actinomadura darangshiensis]|uniref:DNA phosphorothioation-associated putative methyltransferase n=1 Tax=Actinomadura darangshiensis TaxID=705336 RepID=A0A4R5BTU9_9ACTN|nr:DNA phosphorothioation-associated putative methyltransferase [Actinomadura darangshiensis]TDD89525.1 DNA phosphorothioation-associated putative methyltransferase [Actinomadura darangshiensis]
MSGLHWESDRRLTAIGRTTLSVAARQAVVDGEVNESAGVLDYGSGRGHDVRGLREMRFQAQGWDPFYAPNERPRPADVVLLTYVLNVIEDSDERHQTLQRAWELAEHLLVVTTRLTWDRSKVRGQQYEDGVLTSRRTFQHLFSPAELRSYVEHATGVRCVSAAPGIVYAFKNDDARLRYLARKIVPDADWLASDDTGSAIAAVVDYTERRGRMPVLEETPTEMAKLLAHLQPNDLRRIVKKSADPEKVEAGGRASTLSTLLFLAVEVFNGRGPYGSLPTSLQLDVKAFFSSYKEACRRADRLLLKLRDDSYVRGAMQTSKVGKLTPTALYVHRRAVEQMPTVLRLYEHCASIAAGRPPSWTVAKLRHQGRAVSWQDYPEFDADPHPKLHSSYMVDLTTLKTSFKSYAEAANRPLLHRKHEFLALDDPDAPKFRRLTQSEVRTGLYRNPNLIGTEDGWEAELLRCGRELRGHRLVHRKDLDQAK